MVRLNRFCSLSCRSLYIKFGDNWPSGFWEDVWMCHSVSVRVQGQRMTLTFCTRISSFTRYENCIYQFKGRKLANFPWNLMFYPFAIFAHHLNSLDSTPWYVPSFQGLWSFGSAAEGFKGFLPYIGMGAILVMWPGWIDHIFVSPPLKALHEIWFKGKVAFEIMLKNCQHVRFLGQRSNNDIDLVYSQVAMSTVPGRPTNLDYSMARAYYACSRCGGSCLDIFLSSIISLFCLSLSGRQPDIDWNTVSKGR